VEAALLMQRPSAVIVRLIAFVTIALGLLGVAVVIGGSNNNQKGRHYE